MQQTSTSNFTALTRTYWLLTKPGIIFGNAITTTGGFALASQGHFNVWLFIMTLIGLSLVIASACVFNNYIDREADKKMTRTKNRALALGLISTERAILFASLLGPLGALFLFAYTNLLTLGIALFGFFVYVILYSFSKYRTVYGTLIGSIAGAVPPVVGYCAVSNQLDAGALIIFAMIALWQMPHFFAISIYRMEDYAAASIPVLPIKKGIQTTKIHMLMYILAFMIVSSMLVVFNYTGLLYLTVLVILGSTWLGLCLQGFRSTDDKAWARKMFFFSLIIVMGLCIAIPFSKVKFL